MRALVEVDPGCRREAVPQLQVPGGAQPPGAQAGNVAVAEADHAGDGVVEAGRLVEPAPLQQQRAGQGPSFQVERAGDAGTAQPYRPGRLPAARRPGCEQLDDQAGAYLTAVGTVEALAAKSAPGRPRAGRAGSPGPRCVGDLLLGSGKWLRVGHWQFLAGCGTGTTYCYVTDRPRITKDGVPRSRRSREQGSAVAGRGPVAQHVGRVDRRDRTGLRSAVLADLAGPDVELAQVRKPVPDARLHALADPQPAAPPQRGRHVVPRGRRVRAAARQRRCPRREQRAGLFPGRWNAGCLHGNEHHEAAGSRRVINGREYCESFRNHERNTRKSQLAGNPWMPCAEPVQASPRESELATLPTALGAGNPGAPVLSLGSRPARPASADGAA